MNLKHPSAHQLRRQTSVMRGAAAAALIASVLLVILWNSYVGPPPIEFDSRFSPMYILTWQGFGFWLGILAVLISIVWLNYAWIGREIMIHCPQCQYDISSKDDWVCPYCHTENRPRYGGPKDSFYTPLTRCKHCGQTPMAYQCPRCQTLIALDAGADVSRYAFQKTAPDSDGGTGAPR